MRTRKKLMGIGVGIFLMTGLFLSYAFTIAKNENKTRPNAAKAVPQLTQKTAVPCADCGDVQRATSIKAVRLLQEIYPEEKDFFNGEQLEKGMIYVYCKKTLACKKKKRTCTLKGFVDNGVGYTNYVEDLEKIKNAPKTEKEDYKNIRWHIVPKNNSLRCKCLEQKEDEKTGKKDEGTKERAEGKTKEGTDEKAGGKIRRTGGKTRQEINGKKPIRLKKGVCRRVKFVKTKSGIEEVLRSYSMYSDFKSGALDKKLRNRRLSAAQRKKLSDARRQVTELMSFFGLSRVTKGKRTEIIVSRPALFVGCKSEIRSPCAKNCVGSWKFGKNSGTSKRGKVLSKKGRFGGIVWHKFSNANALKALNGNIKCNCE